MLRFDVALQALRQQLKLDAEKTRAPVDAAAAGVVIPFPVRQEDDDQPREKRRKAR